MSCRGKSKVQGFQSPVEGWEAIAAGRGWATLSRNPCQERWRGLGRFRDPRKGHSRERHFRGFSLVELMVVLVIIGLLASVVTINVRQYLIRAKQNTARVEIATICHALDTFYSVYDRYPTNEEGLAILAQKTDKLSEPLLSQLPIDPWGRPYQYNQPGRNGPYEVISYGADGKEGGDPGSADADIVSWNLKEGKSSATP